MATDLMKEVGVSHDVELGETRLESQGSSADVSLEPFYEEESSIRRSMADFKSLLLALERAQQQSLIMTRARDISRLRAQVKTLTEKALVLAKNIRANIDALDKANNSSRLIKGCEEGTFVERTRTNMTNNLKTSLREIVNRFQEVRGRAQDQYKETVARRYFTVTGQQAEPEVVAKLAQDGEGEAIIQRALESQGQHQYVDTILEIQERFDAVKDVEVQLEELHQLFLDTALLVESQGDLANNIEMSVLKAKDHVGKGNDQLVKARKFQLSTRKWTIIGVVAAVIIIVIIIVVLLQILKNLKVI